MSAATSIATLDHAREQSMTDLATHQPPRTFRAILIRHNRIHDLPIGSVAFLRPPGFSGEGLYSFPHAHRADDVMRVCCAGTDRFEVMADGAHRTRGLFMTSAELDRLGVQRVAGHAIALTNDFADFLVNRLGGGAS
jgi:hypothetical protein